MSVATPASLAGTKVLVVGMARSGVAAATLAVRHGAVVTCVDLKPTAPVVPGTIAKYGPHERADFLAADLVIVSPGVPAAQPDVAAAREAGVRVVGELAFAASFLDGVMVAVSGTNGKSTTVHLAGQLLERAALRTFTGGNLGRPLSDAVDGGYEAYAVEVSSYQMELPGTFHPRAAAILNLTPDHLERHGSMDAYGAAKCRMFARMGPDDAAILPAADARLDRLAANLPGHRLWLGGEPGVREDGDALVLAGTRDDGRVPLDGFPLPGAHNRANLAAAVLLCVSAGVPRAKLDVRGLTGLPHRMEIVAERGGVRWIDDSKATNVESSLAAYDGFAGPFVALLGGRAKAASAWSALVRPLHAARGIICFGEAGPDIAGPLELAGLPVRRVPSLDDAVALAATLASRGDAVVLSPACASFDAFTDFEHRGRHFRALVEALP